MKKAKTVLLKMSLLALVLITICLPLLSCKSVSISYYLNTNVPTFTCVTGISASDKSYLSSIDCYEYSYTVPSGKLSKYKKEYMDFLKKNGFAEVESNDSYDFITLANAGDGVIIRESGSTTIGVMPYKRAN